MTARFRFERLEKQNRDDFDCGVEVLNEYLKRRAGQEQRKRFSACFLLFEISSNAIAGFYTLSSGGIGLSALPDEVSKKLPRYPSVPVVRVGRLAVSTDFQGQGIGSLLLFDAIDRSAKSEIGIHAIVVDAKDEKAADFYRHCGFIDLQSETRQLFLPMSDGLRRLTSGDKPH